MDNSGNENITRCIICSSYTLQKQCHNIFSTTLDKGKVLLSDFIKNVLSCSVLIVVSPEFFICKRCFLLCTELDHSLARCNELQETIQSIFNKSKENDQNKNVEHVIVKSEILDKDNEVGEPTDESLQNEVQPLPGETIEDIQYFLETEIIENDATFVTTTYEPIVVREEVYPPEDENDQDNPDKENTAVISFSSTTDPISPNTWKCKTCKMCFGSQELLQNHQCEGKSKTRGIKSTIEFKNYSVKLKRKKKIFFCNSCPYETPISASMQKHLITHKTDASFMCDVCGKRFKYQKTFTQHQLVHDESRPFACNLCPFRAISEVNLRIHEKLHDDQKKYVCSKCGYKTLKKMSYIIHCRTHTGERPYSCPNCPYKAKDPSTLLRHRRIHGGLKRYHCTVCNYKALQKGALTVHMMTHTGEKPHACSHCDYRSSAKHNLAAHIAAIHSDEKPYACNICSYKTKVKRLLTYHMKSHSEEKPFACSVCDYRVRYKGALRYHMRTRHPIGGHIFANRTRPLTACEIKRYHFQGEDVEFSDDMGSDSEQEHYEEVVVTTEA